MSTNKTPNLNLHSWEESDRFTRGEFNENFVALDAAVGDLDAAVSANALAASAAQSTADAAQVTASNAAFAADAAQSTASAALAAADAATQGRGNTKLVWGTYTGDGKSPRTITLTFDGKPLCVEIFPAYGEDEAYLSRVFFGQYIVKLVSSNNITTSLSWTDTSVTIHANNSTYPDATRNASGRVYHYVALVAI